ncbi:hypothetical protein BDZ88DRAFT_413210 [Geranomyces variabilis]|nr:hypothetical protein BDZ88DRAFT_413210 [Geranomyces variabilis]KAJ3136800.1 hypothetical protein HDU90_002365 [Geranomyces variabilis]
MSAVIKELWGVAPAFLKHANRRNLIELVAHAPHRGLGLRVLPTVWHLKGWTDSFYTVTDVRLTGDLAHGRVLGRLTWKGVEEEKEKEIGNAFKHNWHLFQPPSEMRALEKKLRIPPDAPTA